MRTAVTIARILVGVLFIVSGLVKANDPLGLSYKMQEFFEVWNGDLAASTFVALNALLSLFTFLNAHALLLSIVMITLEIMAGVALLLGWKRKAVLWLLLLLIVFFTFLTGFAYASGKFKNCGCFGDCLPITPLASFLKDVALLGLSLFLFVGIKHIHPLVSARKQAAVLGIALALSIGMQWYVLQFLPFVDCLPFKEKASIPEGMKPPPGAVPDSFAIQFVYEKNGKQFEFSPDELPADLASYHYVTRKDKLIRKGNADAPIKGFVLSGITDVDSTDAVLNAKHAVLYFYETDNGMLVDVKQNLTAIYQSAAASDIPVYVITTSLTNIRNSFSNDVLPGLQFFKIDFTAFRSAARSNPTIYLLQNGTVQQKRSLWQSNDILAAINAIR